MAVLLYRGDSWTRSWTFTDATGAPLDLNGAAARLHVRDAAGGAVIIASLLEGRLTVDSVAGRIDMIVPYALTNLAPGSYRFDLEVTFATGIRRTYEQDTLVILEEMAHD